MGDKYLGYEHALEHMNLDSLKERRVKMALSFAKKALKMDNFSSFFPLNQVKMRDPLYAWQSTLCDQF